MFYSFQDFDEDIHYVLKQIKQADKQYDYVVGIKRGGLIPAVCLSHALHIPMYSLEWSTRDFIKQDLDNKILLPKHKILLVDDICDTGETLIRIKEMYNHCDIDTAVIFYNEDQIHIPTYYARSFNRKDEPDWFEFWWESYK